MSDMQTRHILRIAVLLACVFWRHAVAGDALYVPQFGCQSEPFGLRLPSSYLALKSFGSLKREQTIEVDERARTERKFLEFDGLEFVVYTFQDEPTRYLVATAVITKPTWQISGPFRVGQSLEAVRASLKGYGIALGNNLSLGSEGGRINFSEEAGRVREISYECYTG